jgi:hypothetical protein
VYLVIIAAAYHRLNTKTTLNILAEYPLGCAKDWRTVKKYHKNK